MQTIPLSVFRWKHLYAGRMQTKPKWSKILVPIPNLSYVLIIGYIKQPFLQLGNTYALITTLGISKWNARPSSSAYGQLPMTLFTNAMPVLSSHDALCCRDVSVGRLSLRTSSKRDGWKDRAGSCGEEYQFAVEMEWRECGFPGLKPSRARNELNKFVY